MLKVESSLCCGKPRKSRFCPDCGKELFGEGPLWELLLHVEVTAERKENDYREKLGIEGWGEHRLAVLKAAFEKWARWAELLRELLEKK